jgi:methyl-accepting chemotaxis protein
MKSTSRYDRYGALIGLGLPIVGTVLEALRLHGGIGPAALWDAHRTQPLLWIMDTAPFVLGFLGWVIRAQHGTVVRQGEELVQKSQEIVRLEQVRRESLDGTARELFHAAQGLLGNVSEITGTTEGTAATVRETTAALNQLSQAASAAALTAETVIGIAVQSERASEDGLAQAEAAGAELLRLADEVRELSAGVQSLSAPVEELLALSDATTSVAQRTERLAEEASRAAAGAPGGTDLALMAGALRVHAEEDRRTAARLRALMADVQRAVRAAVETAEAGSARAASGARVATKTREAIRGLSVALRESARAAREIARVAQQQEGAIEQVLKAMNEIVHASSGTVRSTQHVEREARSLNDLAASLRDAVKR